jgi:hypothetical protein
VAYGGRAYIAISWIGYAKDPELPFLGSWSAKWDSSCQCSLVRGEFIHDARQTCQIGSIHKERDLTHGGGPEAGT